MNAEGKNKPEIANAIPILALLPPSLTSMNQ